VKRLVFAAAALMAVPKIGVLADTSPSPSLDRILAPAPLVFSAPVTGPLQGHLTQSGFAARWGSDAARAESELGDDGYVDGYGLIRGDTASSHTLVEFVLAFTGQSGALRFLGSDIAESKADPGYKHSDAMSGVGAYYYGIHSVAGSPPTYVDAFEFVKGNDLFGVAAYSPRDDVLDWATAQAKQQFDFAPAETISPNLWPENRNVDSGGGGFSAISGQFLLGILVVGLLGGAAVFVWMRKSELQPAVQAPKQEMTSDGQFWWNGSYWVASSEMPPPWARRSPDGAFWWDGHAWQRVSVAAPPR
jgi:hypothetical protein